MSNQAITWALETRTPGPATKVLLIALANYANESNESYPSIARLAEETDQSPASVKRHIKTLISAGLIVRSMRGSERGGRMTNRYSLVMPARVKAQSDPGVTDQIDLGVRAQSGGVRAQSEGGLGSPVSPEPNNPKNLRKADVSGAADSPSQEVLDLCYYLADKIEANGSKRPHVGKAWHQACRLMIDKDGRTPDKIRKAIDWSQTNTFWRTNVLSMPTLREKYGRLRLAAEHELAEAKKRQEFSRPRLVTAYVSPPERELPPELPRSAS